MSNILWRKSSHSGEAQNACVELAHAPGTGILLRESDDPRTVIETRAATLRRFARAARAGAFDAIAPQRRG
ncbi:hypothetical protein ACZ90_01845 [Streptomyces albus subsp. albus]|nr:hypothetical protein ACZ90_01845 [Streptomyces albus subsp. albus]